jgi:hypothetical protein
MNLEIRKRLCCGAMLIASAIGATGCGESEEAKSFRMLKEQQAAAAKAKAAEVPAYQDPECVKQQDRRLKGEITWAQMTERCSKAFGGPIGAPGGS